MQLRTMFWRIITLALAAALFAACGDDDGGTTCTDEDNDNYGEGCELGPDCDDTDPTINPGATEACDQVDNNCDGQVDEGDACTSACTDDDNDGYLGGCATGDDCDDSDRSVYPGAAEICDQVDNNCDGQVDEGGICSSDCVDGDQDGYGEGCAAGPDCDDTDAAINPGARELCNQADDNCNDQIDEGDVCSTTCVDADSDGYGPGCADGPDCDDGDPAINPGATEVCDQADNNCNDQIDEAGCAGCVDNDGDGYGVGCADGPDCDDTDPAVNPGASEIPGNLLDDDCDSEVDETTASPNAGDIVINEVLVDGATNQDANGDGDIDGIEDEFIELVNVSGAAVDMSGWTVWDANQPTARHTFAAGTSVPAGEAIVVFGGGNAPDDAAGVQFQTVQNSDPGFSYGLGLNNGGDVITIFDASSQEVLSLAYGDQGGETAVADESLTRDPDVTGTFVPHTTASGDPAIIFSPGTKVDGSSF